MVILSMDFRVRTLSDHHGIHKFIEAYDFFCDSASSIHVTPLGYFFTFQLLIRQQFKPDLIEVDDVPLLCFLLV